MVRRNGEGVREVREGGQVGDTGKGGGNRLFSRVGWLVVGYGVCCGAGGFV